MEKDRAGNSPDDVAGGNVVDLSTSFLAAAVATCSNAGNNAADKAIRR